jgi:hypothetical protein
MVAGASCGILDNLTACVARRFVGKALIYSIENTPTFVDAIGATLKWYFRGKTSKMNIVHSALGNVIANGCWHSVRLTNVSVFTLNRAENVRLMN